MLIMWIQQYLLEKKNNCFLKQLGFMIHCLADYCSKAHTVLTQEKPKRIHEHQLMHKTELRIHADQTRKKYKNNQTYQISLFYKRNPVSVANRFFTLLLFRNNHSWSCSCLKMESGCFPKIFLPRI